MDCEPISLILDVQAAASQLSPLGRELLRDDLEALPRILLDLASARGWNVVDHERFTAWAIPQLEKYDEVLVLDKLFVGPTGGDGPRYHRVAAHRRLGAAGQLVLDLSGLPDTLDAADPGVRVAVVDDAMYSGGTLTGVLDRLASYGFTVDRVFVSAATERARQHLERHSGVPVDAYFPEPVRGDVIHAHDVYPWLPHSGRRAEPPGTRVPARRISPLLHRNGAWLSDPELAQAPALRKVAASAVDRLRDHLGREPVATDVALLGTDVAVPLPSAADVPDSTPLRQLLAALL
ncbi:phosphoribosyltransferase [Streptomyces sp. NBC_00708]